MIEGICPARPVDEKNSSLQSIFRFIRLSNALFALIP
jgi:hypothetical protein